MSGHWCIYFMYATLSIDSVMETNLGHVPRVEELAVVQIWQDYVNEKTS